MLGIRTATHTLIYHPGLPKSHQWELFDLRRDSDEVNNLYTSGDHQDLARELQEELQQLARHLEDPVIIEK
jgi:hypothetical protein